MENLGVVFILIFWGVICLGAVMFYRAVRASANVDETTNSPEEKQSSAADSNDAR